MASSQSEIEGEYWGEGRFRIEAKVGEGAMGVVYRAFDLHRQEHVALKTVHDGNARTLIRLKQEFRVLADIAHPNLVGIYELRSDPERWFFAMEYIDGFTLSRYVDPAAPFASEVLSVAIASQPPYGDSSGTESGVSTSTDEPLAEEASALAGTQSMDEAIGLSVTGAKLASSAVQRRISCGVRCAVPVLRTLLPQFVEGIGALHAEGILHRDIKPGNVLVTRQGRLVLLDFGVSGQIEESQRSLAGTPAFMAPEVLRREHSGPPSDWYALGATLMYLLSGQTPADYRRTPTDGHGEVLPRLSAICRDVPTDLDTLCAGLLHPDPAQRLDYEGVCRFLGLRTRGPHRHQGSSHQYAGRTKELARLREAADRVRDGKPTVVLLPGRSGMGKTALVEHFLQRFGEGDAFVLRGRCYANESAAYKGLDAVVDDIVRLLRRRKSTFLQRIVPSQMAALLRLFPALDEITDGVESDAGGSPRAARRVGFHAFGELLHKLGQTRPTLIYLDDLQWIDADGAALLASLLDGPIKPHVLFVASYREEEVESSPLLQSLLETLEHEAVAPSVWKIPVGPLNTVEALEVIDAMPAVRELSSDVKSSVIEEAGGSPYFLRELAIHASTHGLEDVAEGGLERLMVSRVESLSVESRRVLDAIAVGGRPQAARRLAHVTESHGGLGRALHELRTDRLISLNFVEREEVAQCFHDKVRETAVSLLSASARALIHGRIAEAILATGEPQYLELAEHYLASGNRERAGHFAVEAAKQASASFAFERAAGLYRQAIALEDRESHVHALRMKLAEALVNAGRRGEAAKEYRTLSETTSGDESREFLRLASESYLANDEAEEGLALLSTVMSALGESMPETPKGTLVRLLMLRAKIRLRGYYADPVDEADVPAEKLAAIDACWTAAINLTWIDNFLSAYFTARGLLLSLEAGEPSRIARSLCLESGFLSASKGRKGEVASSKVLALAQMWSDRDPTGYSPVLLEIVRALFHYQVTLDFNQCVQHTEAATERLRQLPNLTYERATTANLRMWSLYYLGRPEELREVAQGVKVDAEARGDLYALHGVMTGLPSFHHIARGETQACRDAGRELLNVWRPGTPPRMRHYFALTALCHAMLYEGDAAGAFAEIDQRWARFKAGMFLRIHILVSPFAHLRARCAMAAARDASPSEARRYLKDARKTLRLVPKESRGMKRVLRLLGEGCLRAFEGKQGEARELLQEVIEEADREDLFLYALSARFALGKLTGGDEGRALQDAARVAMDARGVADPDKLAAFFAPLP